MQIKELRELSQWVVISLSLIIAPSTSAQVPYRMYGSYSIVAQAVDSHFQPDMVTLNLSDIPQSVNNVVDFVTIPRLANINQSVGAFELSLHGQLGFFQIKTRATASSMRTTNDQPYSGVGASALSEGELDVVDHIIFHSPTPGTKIINTFWTISGSLAASATGIQHDASGASGDFDWAQSVGESWINVTGTGVAHGSYSTGNGGDNIGIGHNVPQFVYGYHYAIQGGYDPLPTIDHFEGEPPSIVPISFEMNPNEEQLVYWNFDVASFAGVQNKDLNMGTGHAGANATFDHTMTWGGITSVIDKDTGQSISDWTLDSASGFDYSKPFVEVPEPATFLLALCTALVLTIRHSKLRCGIA
jgi:hypothetical protein